MTQAENCAQQVTPGITTSRHINTDVGSGGGGWGGIGWGAGARGACVPHFFDWGGGAVVCLCPPLLTPHFYFPLELYV